MSGRVHLKENGILDEDIPTLQEICYRFLSKNLYVLCSQNEDAPAARKLLEENILLPSEIAEKILHYHQKFSFGIDDAFLNIFSDVTRAPLKYVNIRNSFITCEGLEILFRHKLTSLSMWYCSNINTEARHLLAKYGESLKSLELGLDVYLLRYSDPNEKQIVDFQLNCPKLRRLVMHGVAMHYSLQLSHLQDLCYLDLTGCILNNFKVESLIKLPNLVSLILHNVWPIANQLHKICRIKGLRNLDLSISQTTDGQGTYDLPDQTLEMIVENLENLTHLDISGTNLAGTGDADIPGLECRTHRQLQFLGLYDTTHRACRRYEIPAIQIAGNANEQQIFTAAKYYLDRPQVLTGVLDDLLDLCQFESCKQIHTALDVVLTAMDRHVEYKQIQITGSATLFYIFKNQDETKFGTQLKNHIISTLLNGMEMHRYDDIMLNSGYLALYQFSMRNDVLFEYERIIKILLYGVPRREQDRTLIYSIYFLNTLTKQVDGRQKLFLGDQGVISTMLNLIKDHLSRSVFDNVMADEMYDVMEGAWSIMLNVTDETAINCRRFLDGQGMEYFLTCLRTFPERDELLSIMMGLIGNVAQVKWLRPRLMRTEFIIVFSNILDSRGARIEVSYIAADVLAHLASDGENLWTIETPTRSEVLERMVNAIEQWYIKSDIDYRSLEPIWSLVRCYETPECQHFAVWALANLTHVYPTTYCPLVGSENGLEILNELCNHNGPYTRIKELAQMVIQRCEKFRSKSNNLKHKKLT